MILELFLTFVRIGLFTFGGGYAMISLIHGECVEKKQWITQDEMMNITVIAESTPGPIAVNCATYVGYKKAGIMGAIAATFGVVLPSFIIIYAISIFLENFLEIEWVANAFKGIKIAVAIIILDAAYKLIKKMKKSPFMIAVLACAFVAMMGIIFFSLKLSSVLLMAVAGLCSLCVYCIRKRACGEERKI
jgi:chromate transporter